MEQFRQYGSGLISGNTQLFQSDMNIFLVMKITMNIFMQKKKKKENENKSKTKPLCLSFFECHESGNQTSSTQVGRYVNVLKFLDISLTILLLTSVRVKLLY